VDALGERLFDGSEALGEGLFDGSDALGVTAGTAVAQPLRTTRPARPASSTVRTRWAVTNPIIGDPSTGVAASV
jgi:hypothetical protein